MISAWGRDPEPTVLSDPTPAEGEVLVRVEACGIGLTVLNCINGDLGNDPKDLPRIPGHELVGTIVAVGSGVSRARVGERVGAYFYLFCGRCPQCVAASESLCRRLGGFVGVHRDGGYAELVCLPERNAILLPKSIDPVEATAICDAISTPVHVARRAGIRPHDRVCVIGAGGGVGIHMAQVAALYGAEVLALDAAAHKLSFLQDELGIASADSSDFSEVALPTRFSAGVDVCVDLLGSRDSLRWSLDHLAADGRLCVLTTFRDTTVEVTPRELVFTQSSIVGSRYASRYEVTEAAELVASDRVRPIVTERVEIEDVGAIHRALRGGELLGRGALVFG